MTVVRYDNAQLDAKGIVVVVCRPAAKENRLQFARTCARSRAGQPGLARHDTGGAIEVRMMIIQL